jgi:hypothetical protein
MVAVETQTVQMAATAHLVHYLPLKVAGTVLAATELTVVLEAVAVVVVLLTLAQQFQVVQVVVRVELLQLLLQLQELQEVTAVEEHKVAQAEQVLTAQMLVTQLAALEF